MPQLKSNPYGQITGRGKVKNGTKIHKIVKVGRREVPLCMTWKAEDDKSYKPTIIKVPGRGDVTCYRCAKILMMENSPLFLKDRYIPTRKPGKKGRKRIQHKMVSGGSQEMARLTNAKKGKGGRSVYESKWRIGPTLPAELAAFGYEGRRPTQSKQKKLRKRSKARQAALLKLAKELAVEGKIKSSRGGPKPSKAELDFFESSLLSVAQNPRKRKSTKRKSTKRRSNPQTKAQANAKKAMKLYHSGKARTLKAAWRMVKKGK